MLGAPSTEIGGDAVSLLSVNQLPVAAAALFVLLAAALSGCGTADAHDVTGAEVSSEVTLNEGGDCGGRDVLIDRDGANVVLGGRCGIVTVEANGASVTVDRSEAVVVTGQDIDVEGLVTGSLTVSGRSNTTAVDAVGTVEVRGNVVTVRGTRAERVQVSGSGNKIEFDDVVDVDLGGNDNHMAAETIGVLDVTGSNNYVDWGSGVGQPKTNTGSDNTFTGPGA